MNKVNRVNSFLTSGLGASRPEVIRPGGGGEGAETSGPQRVDFPDPEGGLSRPPPLWLVLEGQAGCQEELRAYGRP